MIDCVTNMMSEAVEKAESNRTQCHKEYAKKTNLFVQVLI